MGAPLTDRHRPATFDAVVGQDAPLAVLSSTLSRHGAGMEIPTSFLLAGPHGTGKTTVARIFGDLLGGEVREVDAAVLNGVDHARKLVASLDHDEPWLTVILDECHSLSSQAWNALLRTMETTPPRTTLVLVTTSAERLPDTVLSRTIHLRFLPIVDDSIVERLQRIATAEEIEVEPEALALIAQRAQGAMRDAIMAFDQVSAVGPVNADTYARVFGAPNLAPAFLAAVAASDVDRALAIAESYATRVTEPAHLAADCIEILAEKLQGSHQPKAILDAIRALWELQDRLSTTRLSVRATIASALAAVAPALAQIRDQPPQRADAPSSDEQDLTALLTPAVRK